MHKGSCLCGSVSFEVSTDLNPPDACHCTQCRKQSGHYWASSNVKESNLKISGEDNLSWYTSSEKVRRGFCSNCGSVLFWDPIEHDYTAVAMGAFDSATKTSIEKHIFVADKGDYYELKDGVPQNEQ